MAQHAARDDYANAKKVFLRACREAEEKTANTGAGSRKARSRPSQRLVETMIVLAARHGQMRDMLKAFRLHCEYDFPPTLFGQPSHTPRPLLTLRLFLITVYKSMLVAFSHTGVPRSWCCCSHSPCLAGDVEKLELVWKEMKFVGLKPSTECYQALVFSHFCCVPNSASRWQMHAYRKSHDHEKLAKAYRSMVRDGLKPSADVYELIIRYYAETSQIPVRRRRHLQRRMLVLISLRCARRR